MGHIDYGEDFLTAALREVKEETNLDIEIESLLSVTSNFLALGVHSLVAVLLARPLSASLKAGDDAVEAKWFRWGDELPALAFEADGHIIERFFTTGLAGAPVDPRFSHR
jgi:ADP-ribose pyrophosphatase YjhB (NUDIX family)